MREASNTNKGSYWRKGIMRTQKMTVWDLYLKDGVSALAVIPQSVIDKEQVMESKMKHNG